MTDKKVFVIVVSYKGKQWYDRCFTSLHESALPVRTIVVDNASSDGSVEYIREKYPEIHLIESKENLGFGRANNIAMRYALDHGCDYVFLLNQDAWIEPETISHLVEIHQKHSEFGILSPIHLNVEKDKIEKGLINYLDDKKITDRSFFEDMYFNRVKDVYETNFINAAAWLLPVKTLETVGGFDPLFLHYGEDDNYMQRVAYHKMTIGICPLCKVVHDTERRVLPGSKKKLITENKDLLVNVANVNHAVNMKAIRWYYFRKSAFKLLRLQFSQFVMHWNFFRFLGKHKRAILNSRARNIKIGPSWL